MECYLAVFTLFHTKLEVTKTVDSTTNKIPIIPKNSKNRINNMGSLLSPSITKPKVASATAAINRFKKRFFNLLSIYK